MLCILRHARMQGGVLTMRVWHMACSSRHVRNAPTSPDLRICRQPRDENGRLIQRYAPLVNRIARHVRQHGGAAIDPADLVQTGMVALVEAAQRYEDRGFAFATYAATRIRGAMIDHLRRHSPRPRSAILFRRAADQARAGLTGALGRAPTDHQMAAALAMPAELYRRRMNDAAHIRLVSLADVYSDRLGAFADQGESAEDLLCRAELAARLAGGLARLGGREARVLHLYFAEDRSLADIGTELGVGAARVCQIKQGALQRLRSLLASSLDPG
jgi:RNA polymerase sigma factor FliA